MRDFWKKVGFEAKKVLKQWYTVMISCGIWSVLLYFWSRGRMKKRIAVAAISFRSGLKNLNEYVKSFSLFATKQIDVILAGSCICGGHNR